MRSKFPSGDKELEILITHPVENQDNETIGWHVVIGKPEQMTVPLITESYISIPSNDPAVFIKFKIFYCKLFPVKS